MPFIIAHGSLGSWDELIFLGVFVVFIGMMIFSWVRSRAFEADLEDLEVDTEKSKRTPERFELE